MSNFVSKKGRIEYIEPNNINLASDDFATKMAGDTAIPHPYENYSIAVDLYVKKANRNSCGQPENNGNNTSVFKYTSDSASFFEGTKIGDKNWLTANFTDIDTVNPIGNTSECLGITSISIEYRNVFMPIVTINFTDVRGASLFSKEEKSIYDRKATGTNNVKNNRINTDSINGSNLYKTLFMFPYPIFTLVVKGIYGDAVSYNLSITNVNTNFNETSGDFELSVKFVGSLFGVLADIPMTFLAIAPYIENGGKDHWEEQTTLEDGRFKMFSEEKGLKAMPKYLDLIKLESNISDKIKKNFDSNDDVIKYKELLSNKHDLSNLKLPLATVTYSSAKTNVWYCNKKGSGYLYYYIGRGNGKGNPDAASEVMSKKVWNELGKFNEKITAYNKLFEDNQLDTLDGSNNLLDKNYYEPIQGSVNNLRLKSRYKVVRTVVKGKVQVICYDLYDNEKDLKLQDLCDIFPKFKEYVYGTDFCEETNTNDETLFIYYLVARCNYSNEIKKSINTLNKSIKGMQDSIEGLKKDALINAYDFSPNIANMFGINFAHLETFMNSLYKCLSDIASKQPNGVIGENSRTLGNFGINVDNTDLNPDKYKSDSFLPPFVSFYKHNDETNKDELIWPGKIEALKDLDEVKYVERLINAISTYTEDKEALDAEINPNVTRETNFLATSLYEYVLKSRNPYREILKYIDKANVIDCVVLIFSLRYYYYSMFYGKYFGKLISNGDVKCNIPKLFGYSEAENFTKVIGKSKSIQVIENILNIYDDYNNSNDINSLFSCITGGRNCDLYPINGRVFTEKENTGEIEYTWLKTKLPANEEIETEEIDPTTQNKVTKIGLGERKYFDERLDDTDYGDGSYKVLPISGFDFSKIKDDYNKNIMPGTPGYIFYGKSEEGCAVNTYDINTFIHVKNPGEIINKLSTYSQYDDTVISGKNDSNKIGTLDDLILSSYYDTIDNSGNTFGESIKQVTSDDISGNTKAGLDNLTFDKIVSQNSPTEYKQVFSNMENSCVSDFYSNVRNASLNGGDINKNYNIDNDDFFGDNIFFHELYYNQNISEQVNGTKRDGDLITEAKAYLFLFSLVNAKNDFLKGYYRDDSDIDSANLPEGAILKTELLKEGAFWWRMDQLFNGREDSQGNNVNKMIIVTGEGKNEEEAKNNMWLEVKKNKNLYDKENELILFDLYYTNKDDSVKGNVKYYGHFMWDPIYVNEAKYKRPMPYQIFYTNDGNILKEDVYAGLTFIDAKNKDKTYYDLISSGYTFYHASSMGEVVSKVRYYGRTLNISISRIRYLIDMFESWALGKSYEYTGKKSALPSFKAIMDKFEIKSDNGTRSFTFEEDIEKSSNRVKITSLKQRFLYEPGNTEKDYLRKTNDGRSYYLTMFDRKGIDATFKKDYEEAQRLLLSLLLDVDFIFDASRFYEDEEQSQEPDYTIALTSLTKTFDYFIEKIKKYGYDTEEDTKKTADKFSRDDLKLSLYTKLKNLYDRWLCSYNINHWNYYLPPRPGWDDKKCEDNKIYACKNKESISTNMQYLDICYNRIGYKLLVDLTKYCNIIKTFTTTASSGEKNINNNLNKDTMVTLMSEIAQNCNCMMLCLPFMFGTDGYSDLQSIFIPKDFNSIDLTKDTSTFAVVYKPDISQHIDNNDDFYDDGYDIADTLGNINPVLPTSITEGIYNYGEIEDTKIPAFGVTFGKQNQSYFSSVKINSDRAQMTEYAIKAIQNVVSEGQTGAKNAYSYGQDIYDFYANYVYSCSVTMMGCMRITPLMYFQLNNIPMFHGAYSITSVSHSISPGSITTTFDGTRMNKKNTPFASGELFVLDTSSWGLDEYSNELANLDDVWINDENVEDTMLSDSLLSDIMTKTDNEATSKLEEYIQEGELYGTGDYTKEVNKPDAAIAVKNVYAYAFYFTKNRLYAQYGPQYLRFASNSLYSESQFKKEFVNIKDSGDEKFVPHKSNSTKELENLMYTVGYKKIPVGVNIYGSDIVDRLNGISLLPGDVLVYYAVGNDEDKLKLLKEKEQKAAREDGPEFDGAIQFYYNRKIRGVEYKFMSYNKKNDGKTFIFDTNKKRLPEYFKWNVDVYRFTEFPLGKINAIGYDLTISSSTVSGITDDAVNRDPKQEFINNGNVRMTVANQIVEGYENIIYDTCSANITGFDVSGGSMEVMTTLRKSASNIISGDTGTFNGVANISKMADAREIEFTFTYTDPKTKSVGMHKLVVFISRELRADIEVKKGWVPETYD